MEMRVEQLSAQADVSVDTIRYYQSKGLLAPPRREGRIAWYGDEHLERLGRIRSLQQRGFTLATIARLVSGELDAADEALLGQLSGCRPAPTAGRRAGGRRRPDAGRRPARSPTAHLLARSWPRPPACPLALLKALEAEGLLIPTRVAGQERYTEEDVAASRAGLLLLEWGIPLSDLLDLARRHNEATEAMARQAVELFARHVRDPLRTGARPDALAHGGPAAGATDDPPSTASCRPTPSCCRPSTPWSATTSPAPWCGWRSTTSSGRDRTRSARRSGTGSAPTAAPPPGRRRHRRDARAGDRHRRRPRRPRAAVAVLGRHLPRGGRPGPRGRPPHRGRRRPSSSGRCSTPSPPATTWSTAP